MSRGSVVGPKAGLVADWLIWVNLHLVSTIMSTDLRMEFERVAQSLLTANLHLVGKNCAQSQMDALHAQICKLRENIRSAKATLLAKQAEIQAKTVIINQSF